MSKTLTLRLDEETYHMFAEAARSERRSIANLIETSALAGLREKEFIDDYEAAEILANDDLVARLRQGSADARARKGRFVD